MVILSNLRSCQKHSRLELTECGLGAGVKGFIDPVTQRNIVTLGYDRVSESTCTPAADRPPQDPRSLPPLLAQTGLPKLAAKLDCPKAFAAPNLREDSANPQQLQHWSSRAQRIRCRGCLRSFAWVLAGGAGGGVRGAGYHHHPYCCHLGCIPLKTPAIIRLIF